MRLGIVACEILKKEIELLTRDDPDFIERIYLEFALHLDPPVMRKRIIETVNSLKGKVDAVLLGYAICSSLQGVAEAVDLPAVILRGADCFDSLMGTDEYERQKKICRMTWFELPGWAEEGVDGLIKVFHLDSAEGYDPSFFLDMMFDTFERVLYVDTGIGDRDHYVEKAQDFADKLHLRLDCSSCGLESIQASIDELKSKFR